MHYLIQSLQQLNEVGTVILSVLHMQKQTQSLRNLLKVAELGFESRQSDFKAYIFSLYALLSQIRMIWWFSE